MKNFGFPIKLALILALFSLTFGAVNAQDSLSTPLITWHPDGTMLAITVANETWIIDATTMDTLNTFTNFLSGLSAGLQISSQDRPVWTQDGSRIAISHEDADGNWAIQIWSSPWSPSEASLAAVVPLPSTPNTIAVNPSGSQLVAGIGEIVVIVEVSGVITHQIFGEWTTAWEVVWTPDNRVAVTGGGKMTAIIDPVTSEIITSFYTSGYEGLGYNTAIAFSPDGNKIAIADENGVIEIRGNTRTTEQFIKDVDVKLYVPYHPVGEGEDYEEHPTSILDVDWNDDGRYIATSSADSTVRVWDASTGENLSIINVGEGRAVRSIAWRPNTLELAVGCPDASVVIIDYSAEEMSHDQQICDVIESAAD